jgi:hypothetical protein
MDLEKEYLEIAPILLAFAEAACHLSNVYWHEETGEHGPDPGTCQPDYYRSAWKKQNAAKEMCSSGVPVKPHNYTLAYDRIAHCRHILNELQKNKY